MHISPLLLIRWGASQVQFYYYYCNQPIWLAHHSNKMKLRRLRKIGGSTLKYKVPLLGPSCIGEMTTTFAKAHGIKVRCYWKHVGEHIGNLMGTHWDLEGNRLGTHWEQGKMLLRTPLGNTFGTWWEPIGILKGTCWEQRKNLKIPPPPPQPKLERKKIKELWVHAEPSHWLHEISMFQKCSSPFLACV
jgi:hypothetical protein